MDSYVSGKVVCCCGFELPFLFADNIFSSSAQFYALYDTKAIKQRGFLAGFISLKGRKEEKMSRPSEQARTLT